MQVQSIQTTDNCRKPCFKAYLVNDAAGNFRNLWETANKGTYLDQKIKGFANLLPNHGLEITKVRDGYSRVNSGHDAATVFGNFYKVFNHFTGKFAEYFVSCLDSQKLFNLLGRIENDRELFKNDPATKSYRYLTGQENPRIKI